MNFLLSAAMQKKRVVGNQHIEFSGNRKFAATSCRSSFFVKKNQVSKIITYLSPKATEVKTNK
jgi:hypothetical protein